MAGTGLLQPLDCPVESNHGGQMHLETRYTTKGGSPTMGGTTGHGGCPGLESLLDPLVYWSLSLGRHRNCWELHHFYHGDCGHWGTAGIAVGILVTRAPELPAQTGPSLPPSLPSFPCCPCPGAGTRAQEHRSSCTWGSQGWPATCYHYCGSILNGDQPKQATTDKSLILALCKLTWIKEYELESFETIKKYSLSWFIVSKISIGLIDL